jgi:Arc/MetJ-type ribon-helix-helix transcriptional regulator
MTRKEFRFEHDLSDLFDRVREELHRVGVDFEFPGSFKFESEVGSCGPKVKVVAVGQNIKDSVEEMGQSPRDQVVMVRIDEETSKKLDAWVETGAVKSRSEAAALFIREGLKVHEAELEKFRDALHEVEAARERLKKRVQEVFGDEG